jgi:hypothetical protein
MKNRASFRILPALLLGGTVALAAGANGGCSQAAGLAEGCSEFNGGASAVASLSIDANTKAFVSASADLVAVGKAMEAAVLKACIAIDVDLGVTDTWTAKAPTDGSNPDAELTEACNQASAKIQAILAAGEQAQAFCSLSVSGGQCTVDASVQATCEGQCTGSAMCQPGDVTVRCDPGQLSGQCDANCSASAVCEGSASVAANCQGSCEADCQGECDATPGTAPKVDCQGTCSGKCYGTCNGTATGAGGMANCSGTCAGQCDANCTYQPGMTPKVHCAGTCTGKCTGSCKLAANAMVNCGAMVNCKGGCSVAYKAPKCEGELKPPSCNVDANCEASCQSHAEATASCTPPQVALDCTATATGDIPKLVATLQANLPAIVLAVESQGQLAIKASGHVVSSGTAVVANITSAGGKALACAQAAVSGAASASASVNVSVMASASVSGSAGGPTKGS